MQLETRNLTKKFGNLTAVDSVNLEVGSGEIRGIIGPNGAGKTTLFNLISGDLEPTEGRIKFKGKNVTKLSVPKRVKLGIGRSFQIPKLFEGLPVKDNIAIGIQAYFKEKTHCFERNIEEGEIEDKVDEIIEIAQLEDYQNKKASELSHGYRRRLELGLLLSSDPDLLLLDEPTAGVSPEELEPILDILRDLKGEKTILLVEHNLDVVFSLSQKITVLDEGKICVEGNKEKVRDNEFFKRLYLGG